MNKDLIGTGIALITPFDNKGNVDNVALENVVNHAIDGGVDYLVLMGTTAEAVTLSREEKEAVISKIIEVNNSRVPMVLGVGGSNTVEVIHSLNTMDLDPFTAILSVSPSYNKPTQAGIYAHFEAIAQATDKDIILYNVPARTASNIEPQTTINLAENFKNIVAIKEASPNYMQSSLLLNHKPKDFMVLSGDDAHALPMILAGGQGVISVIGQALPDYSAMVQLGLERKVDEAYNIYYRMMDLMSTIYLEGNPAGVKALLEVQGLCNRNTRLPLIKASDELKSKIKMLFDSL